MQTVFSRSVAAFSVLVFTHISDADLRLQVNLRVTTTQTQSRVPERSRLVRGHVTGRYRVHPSERLKDVRR